jgi:hypothetical protein
MIFVFVNKTLQRPSIITMTPSNDSAIAALTPSSNTVVPKHLFNHCVCKWNDCRSFQEAFTAHLMDGTKELRGSTRAIHLDLTGDDPEKAIWRKAFLSNLSAPEVSYFVLNN